MRGYLRDLLFSLVKVNLLFFLVFKSQPLDVLLPHVLHLDPK